MRADAPVWVLLGTRTGDNNQLLRLASELGQPFRELQLSYNPLHRVPPSLLGATVRTLQPPARALIAPPWPRLVLGIGYRSVPVALRIRELSGATAKLVRLGNPRLDPGKFDLVITTPQYSVPEAANVIRLPVGISTAPELEETPQESEWLSKLPRPHRLLLIGGDTFMWQLSPSIVASAASAISAKPGGSTIASPSPRSEAAVIAAAGAALDGSAHAIVTPGLPRYPVLLQDADEIYVTADSVAMISDAVATGKPVGLVHPEPTSAGSLFYGLNGFGVPVPIRDVRRFWRGVEAKGLAGSVAEPVSGAVAVDALKTAVSAVKALL